MSSIILTGSINSHEIIIVEITPQDKMSNLYRGWEDENLSALFFFFFLRPEALNMSSGKTTTKRLIMHLLEYHLKSIETPSGG